MIRAKQAEEWDKADPLAHLRSSYHFPKDAEGRETVYLTGNSLGLQPKAAEKYLLEELEDWKNLGVEGHTRSRRPWVDYHSFFQSSLARIVGAKTEEVVPMNGLTANLHLLMVSFFRPDQKRNKLLIEAKAFPSDLYALRSQLRFHGLTDDHLILLENPDGSDQLHTEDILKLIEERGDEIALSLMGGVNYYTGQLFDMQRITKALKAKGAMVGWDLAHAAGNVPLALHDWDVDMAAWCSYKYLNSGPGSVAGIFIHERHHNVRDIPRFEGWWGHDDKSRFLMDEVFEPMKTAEAWQLSNAPVLAMAAHRAALDLFDQTSMEELRKKSVHLTGILEGILLEIGQKHQTGWRILTPADPKARGCQLSLFIPSEGKALFDHISSHGVVADWRNPNVIRMAPVPMYNSYSDLYRLQQIILDFYEET